MRGMVILLVAGLVGCAGQTLIVLKNPKTGEMAQCQTDSSLFGAAAKADECAKAYEAAGWVRM